MSWITIFKFIRATSSNVEGGRMKIFNSTDCKGQVLVIVIISIITLVILVGLAIDSGRAYSVRAKLNGALDAAGIAAARAVADSDAAARDAALTFFNSNYPTGYMESTPVFCPDDGNPTIDGDPTITPDPTTGDVAITVWARANMPTLFMKIVGQDSVNVSATTTATRRAVDLAFVVDNTGSIGSDGDNVKARSIDFVRAFHPNFDRMALIKYAFGAQVPVTFATTRGFNQGTVENEINAFIFTGGTNCAEGFWNAKRQHNIVNNPASLRVIVFFTDGVTNTFASTFYMSDNSSGNPNDLIYDTKHCGSIATSESGEWAAGFWRHYRVQDPNKQGSPVSGDSDIGYYWTNIKYQVKKLPQYYNPCQADAIVGGICIDPHTDDYGSAPSHPNDCGCNNDPNKINADPDDLDVFNVITDTHPLRPVTQLTTNFSTFELYKKINRASRNLLEEMAKKARQQGIYVYTLGLGSQLQDLLGPAMANGQQERGEDLLRNMANTEDADTHDSGEPKGIYCHAATADDLGPCYNRIIEEIIRLTI
jgi:type II secretory pathway pseudopilin PulG